MSSYIDGVILFGQHYTNNVDIIIYDVIMQKINVWLH